MTDTYQLEKIDACSTDNHELRIRFDTLYKENISLKAEIADFKVIIKTLKEENLDLRQHSINLQVRAEQEEEYISNKLLKKITELKREKESLALNYEQEEEFLTNDLTRKLNQLRDEKVNLENTLEKEQEAQISKLKSRIQKLENEVELKQKGLDTLRHEKIELENSLEQEQEGLVNKLWKKLEKLEAEKRLLQSKLDLSPSPIMSTLPRDFLPSNSNNDLGVNKDDTQNKQSPERSVDEVLSNLEEQIGNVPTINSYIFRLKQEVARMRNIYNGTNALCSEKLQSIEKEERNLKEENKRLHKRLQLEIERRQEICRNLSESESSLEIDEERQFNEVCRRGGNVSELLYRNRVRTASDGSNIYRSSTPRSLRCSVDCSFMKLDRKSIPLDKPLRPNSTINNNSSFLASE